MVLSPGPRTSAITRGKPIHSTHSTVWPLAGVHVTGGSALNVCHKLQTSRWQHRHLSALNNQIVNTNSPCYCYTALDCHAWFNLWASVGCVLQWHTILKQPHVS
jgi:hypothetical protein